MSYREMLDQAKLHAVVVSVPDDLHYPITMQALAAGLHVMCEKPLAMTAAQAREMYEQAEAAGVKHMTLFSWRYMPHHQYLRKLVEDGYLGRGYHAQFRFFGGGGRNSDYQWRFDRRHSNGVLGDLGSHMIDLARLLCGEISSVSGRLSTCAEHLGADSRPMDATNDTALVSVEFASGMIGMLHVSAVAHMADEGLDQRISLHGAAGTLESELVFAGPNARGELRGARAEEEHVRPIPVPAHYYGGVETRAVGPAEFGRLFTTQSIGNRLFIDAIVEDRPASPNFYDAWKVQQVIDAAIVSDARGCWTEVA